MIWENEVNDSIIDRRKFHESFTCVWVCLTFVVSDFEFVEGGECGNTK